MMKTRWLRSGIRFRTPKFQAIAVDTLPDGLPTIPILATVHGLGKAKQMNLSDTVGKFLSLTGERRAIAGSDRRSDSRPGKLPMDRNL